MPTCLIFFWHGLDDGWFGHLNHSYIDRLIKDKLVEGMNCSTGKVNRKCEACVQGMMHRIPFPKKSDTKTSQPLKLVHSDLCEPMNVGSIGGSKYLLTLTDDYTRYVNGVLQQEQVWCVVKVCQVCEKGGIWNWFVSTSHLNWQWERVYISEF